MPITTKTTVGDKPNLYPNQYAPGLKNKLKSIKSSIILKDGDKVTSKHYQKEDGTLAILETRNSKTNDIEYRYQHEGKTVIAYDEDGDGYIDRFKYPDVLNNMETYVNPKDNGENNFVKEHSYPGGNWNPLNWF